MQPYLLSLDQGTTSTRAIIFNLQGQAVARAQLELKQYFPADGWVEHDAEEIAQSSLAVCREALQQSGITAQQIAAIGITNQRETTVVWDRKTGKPIHKAIVWQDRRTADTCLKLKNRGHETMVQQKTGLLQKCKLDKCATLKHMISKIEKLYRQFPARFWIIVLTFFIDSIGGTLLFPFFSLYITEKFNVGMTQAGMVLAMFSIFGIIGNMIGGALTDLYDTDKLTGALTGSIKATATGNGNAGFFQGSRIEYFGGGARTHSVVMRSRSGTVRYIDATHRWDKLMRISNMPYG